VKTFSTADCGVSYVWLQLQVQIG